MTTTEPKASTPGKNLTPKQRQIIAVSALALALLVGVGVVYWFMFGTSPTRRMVEVDPSQQDTRMPNQRGGWSGRRPDPRGINRIGSDRWMARSEAGAMIVNRESDEFRIQFQPNMGLGPEELKILLARVRIINDQAMAKQWGITPEQIEQLKQMGSTKATEPSESDRAELAQLFAAYRAAADGAPRSEAEKKVMAKLEASLKAAQEPTAKAYAERVARVRQILTPEQVEKVTATSPATRPSR